MATRSILLLFLLLSIRGLLSLSENFTFRGFRGVPDDDTMHLNGAARIEHNGILRLTNDTHRLVSHAFYGSPITLKNNSTDGKAISFSTAFVFAILPGNGKPAGHGFAFTITNSRELPGALPSQYLGLMNATHADHSSNRVFAVEFDTVRDFEFGDIDDNHVGIDINSMVSNASVTATCFTSDISRKEKCNLQSGKMIQAWIDYSSDRQRVDVTLSLSSSKPSVPILSFPVDLSPVFMDDMYVGFSASTGLLASSHFIAGWSFATNGEAQSLDLSSLPSIPGLEKNQLPVILGASLSAATLLALAVLASLHIIKKIKARDEIESWELDIGPHRFSYGELKKATRGFKDKELLGFGGFGRVYKGTLPSSSTHVAVKRINHESNHQGLTGFLSEIASIGRLRHRNLVALQGWCRRGGDLLLVYDFMPNGSLDKYIFDEPKIVLTWEQRFNIIKGVASGLLYLHEEWEQTVIHRDIKAANVLLDAEMNGRLGDFGLAKLYEHGAKPSTTKVVGTLGYLAPELTKTGKPTTSSDVFAFGAVLLEVVCGRRPVEAKALPEELVLVDWVWEKWGTGSMLEVVDPRLKGEFNEVEVIMVIKLGLMCSNNGPARRPRMRQVVRHLQGEAPLPEAMSALNKIDSNNSSDNDHLRSESEDFVHSYPSYDGEEDIDLEAGPLSPVPASCRRNGG